MPPIPISNIPFTKIAITNHRITNIDNGKVSFRYKDYRQKGKQKIMTLDEWEFIKRFARHIVPPKFGRIRHYGLLANSQKKKRLQAARSALAFQPLKPTIKPPPPKKLNHITCYCPTCETVTEQLIMDILPPIRAGLLSSYFE